MNVIYQPIGYVLRQGWWLFKLAYEAYNELTTRWPVQLIAYFPNSIATGNFGRYYSLQGRR